MNQRLGVFLTVVFSVTFAVVIIIALTSGNSGVDGIKEKAYIKPSGFSLVKLKVENQTFIVKEMRSDELTWNGRLYSFKTLNDTQIRTVNTSRDGWLSVGDVVTLQKITYEKKCDVGVYIQLPDGFNGEVPDILPRNFHKEDIPKYYTDRYYVVVDLGECNSYQYQYFDFVTSGGKTTKMESDREIWN